MRNIDGQLLNVKGNIQYLILLWLISYINVFAINQCQSEKHIRLRLKINKEIAITSMSCSARLVFFWTSGLQDWVEDLLAPLARAPRRPFEESLSWDSDSRSFSMSSRSAAIEERSMMGTVRSIMAFATRNVIGTSWGSDLVGLNRACTSPRNLVCKEKINSWNELTRVDAYKFLKWKHHAFAYHKRIHIFQLAFRWDDLNKQFIKRRNIAKKTENATQSVITLLIGGCSGAGIEGQVAYKERNRFTCTYCNDSNKF